MTKAEYIVKIDEIADSLQKQASNRRDFDVSKANDFYAGYYKACEDFNKVLRFRSDLN